VRPACRAIDSDLSVFGKGAWRAAFREG